MPTDSDRRVLDYLEHIGAIMPDGCDRVWREADRLERETGRPAHVERLAFDLEQVRPGAIEEAQKHLARKLSFCPDCGAKQNVAGYALPAILICPVCRVRFGVQPGLFPRAVAEDRWVLDPWRAIDRDLPGFSVEAAVARGGQGSVFRAVRLEDRRRVALKVVDLSDPRPERQVRRRFARECDLARRLRHPGLVELLDAIECGRVGYLVLAWVEGPNLQQVLNREGPLPPARVVDLARQACDVLAYAHEMEFVHRDLKPANLIVSPDGKLTLVDLGLAKPVCKAGLSGLTLEGTVMGTYATMAPEQLEESRDVDAAADLYALGATLYWLISGEPPIRAESLDDMRRRIGVDRPVPLEERVATCPIQLARLVQALMQKRREDRPASAREALAALSSCAAV